MPTALIDLIDETGRLLDIAFKMLLPSDSILAFARHSCRAFAFVDNSERSYGGTESGVDNWSIGCQDGYKYSISVTSDAQDSICTRNTFARSAE